ncbi:MAG: hypothetical protein JWM64_2629 [Frankiales bacterium]|nr:hypothetical protein [Frankiales bacterium]
MGEVVGEGEFPDHAAALQAAREDETAEVQRVEHLGPDGDWRWSGPVLG